MSADCFHRMTLYLPLLAIHATLLLWASVVGRCICVLTCNYHIDARYKHRMSMCNQSLTRGSENIWGRCCPKTYSSTSNGP